MRLEKLELSGFKSFPDRTILRFEPGITAIVGPNGSGKSNIFDAIKWVLGEQSVKEMRGSKMEDVIFNGTESRPPLGMAEASLFLSNEDKKLPIDTEEVIITRRIFRSGENEYLLNHNPVRLKDILDLLLGTGMGIDSYSLVGQGKIDLILSSKPEDRRIIFDEASGILKYKLQKKEAMRRLEETENNLLRINDIIQEVRRQINSLERQVNKARKYKELFEQLKEKEKTLSIYRIELLNKQRQSLKSELDNYLKIKDELNQTYQQDISEYEILENTLKDIQQQFFHIKEELINLDSHLERNQRQRQMLKERVEETKIQQEKLDFDLKANQERIAQLKQRIHSFQQDFQNLKQDYESKIRLIQEKENQLKELSMAKIQAKENIEQLKKEVLELTSRRTKLKNEIVELNTRIKVFEARERRLKVEELKCIQTREEIQTNLNRIKEDLSNLEAVFMERQHKEFNLRDNLKEEVKAVEEIKTRLQNLEKERIALLSQKEFLENLNYQQKKDSLDIVILTERLPCDNLEGLLVKIKEKNICSDMDKVIFNQANFRLSAEARPIDLNLERISKEIEHLEERISQDSCLLNQKNNYIENLNVEIEDLAKQMHQLELKITEQREIFNHIDKQLKKIDEELEIIRSELAQSSSEIGALKEKESQLIKEDNDLEGSILLKEGLIKKEGENTLSLDSQREVCLLEITQLKTEKDSLEQTINRQSQTLEVLETDLKELEFRSEDYQKQIKECIEKDERLNKELEELELLDKELISEREKKLQSQQDKLFQIEDKQRQLMESRKTIEELRNQIQNITNQINEQRLKLQDIDFKILNIKERLKQLYQIELLEEGLYLSKDLNEEVINLEIETLREKIDSLGTVNLVAIEEYDEFEKRYAFLTQQQQDLMQAKNSLYEAIQKINRTAKSLFMDTFKLIVEEFKGYFRLLFGGGDAELFLIDENDPLESGVEIIARPPGKKLQNISLLSGGEKALCAIALIFAIFKVKPSPFCILDEVDAALDEANISRYASLLDEFSKNTQFIVITHNKRTLLNADVMYGITMQESGISRIVSVKFKDKDLDKQPKEVGVF